MAIRWVIGAMLAIAGCSASDGTTAQNKPAGVAERAPSADCSRFDYARCIALSPTERMRGVWLSGFERSSFLAGAEAVPNGPEIGRAHVLTPVPNAHLVCRLLLEKKKRN